MLKLWRTTRGNLLSPFSLNRALLSVREGMGEDSKAKRELDDFLQLEPKEAKRFMDYISEVRNSKVGNVLKLYQILLWNEAYLGFPKQSFLHVMEYTDLLIMNDQTNVSKMIEKINLHISNATNKNIPKLIEIDSKDIKETKIILANSIYFNAKWAYPFPEQWTAPKIFYTQLGEKKIQTMQSGSDPMFVHLLPNQKEGILCEFSYQNLETIRFGVWMPPKSIEWKQFLDSFSFQKLTELTEELKLQQVYMQIPKFEISQKYDNLQENFKEVGVNQIFSDSFDFSKATSSTKPITVSKIIHEVLFKIHEKGTEATAATAIVFSKGASSRLSDVLEVELNRPFLFYLRDISQPIASTGLLFLGTFTGL